MKYPAPKLSVFVITSLVALLAACTPVGPNFKAPGTPDEKFYTPEKEVLSDQQRLAVGKQLDMDWWRLYASNPLNDLIDQAMKDNYTIAAAQETLAQAEDTVKAANGGLVPRFSLGASAMRQKYGVALFGPSNFKIPPFNAYEVGPSMSWDLDLFGGKKRGIEQQQALAEYQSHELDAAYVTLTGNVVAQALEIAAAKAEISAVEKIIAEDQKTLNLVNKALKAGAETKVDVLTVQSQLENNQTLLPPLQQRLSVARHALAVLVGKAPGNWTPPEFTLDSLVLPKELPISLPSELAHKRPDILAAEAQLHAASAVGVATANMYPNITLSGSLLQEALVPGQLFRSANNAWSIGGGLTAPLLNGGTLKAEKSAAEHAYEGALDQYQQTVLRAFQQVADALSALSHDGELYAEQQKAYNTSHSSLNLMRKSFQAGEANLLQVQDAERQMAQAQVGLVRAQSQRYQDTATLFVALGGSPVPRE
jgi:NodT family efflux transporter outer membrane factor (OMF) lipoprotein